MYKTKRTLLLIVSIFICDLIFANPILNSIYDNDGVEFRRLVESGVDLNAEPGKDSPLLAIADNCRVEMYDVLIEKPIALDESFLVLNQAILKDCPAIYFKLVGITGIKDQKHKDNLLLNSASLPYENITAIHEDLINRGASPITVTYGEIWPNTPLKAAFKADQYNKNKASRMSYEFLLEKAMSMTGYTEKKIHENYVEKFMERSDCEGC